MINSNILSERYASEEINEIFSEKGKILRERDLWITVMKAQKELGIDIPTEDIDKYEKAKTDINLEEIKAIEKITQHDVKARIEAFVKVSGAKEHLHKGMTSRDLTDNVEQMQIKKASQLVFGKYLSVLRHFCDKAQEYENIILTARTHHQAAQPTLLGRRFSMWAEELNLNLLGFEHSINNYPLRGIKGPVGTQFDMLTLLGDKKKVELLERKAAEELGFFKVLYSPGQVYPRSLDLNIIFNLSLCSSACENFAKSMRLMAGYELVTEGFKEGRVGSSAMPHKMNTSHSERICGLSELVKMYVDGASRLSGDQWEEGDVSCSALRRVIIPDAFYASDGICETTLTVLNEMGVYPVMISKEVDRHLPFLATTEILMSAVDADIGREEAHKIIKKYAVSEALRMKKEGSDKNNLAELIAKDPIFSEAGITIDKLNQILSERNHFVGNAKEQIYQVVTGAKQLFEKYPLQAGYEPKSIL